MSAPGARPSMARRPSSPLARALPLYAVVFIGFVGYSLMITTFTPLLLRGDGGMLPASASTGARTAVLGALLALYPLAQFVGSPVLGALSDRVGRRRVLLVSLGLSAAWYALIAMALHERSLGLLMAASVLAGLSEANIAIAQSAIADVAPVAERGRLFGYVYLSSSLAYVAGPLGGGKLADAAGYPAPFLAVVGLLVVALVLVLVGFPETHRPEADAGPAAGLRGALAGLGAAFAAGPLRPVYAANLLLYLAIFGFFRVYPMYLVDHFGMGVSRESEYVAWVAVPIVVANLGLVAWLSRRWSPAALTARFGVGLAVALAAVVVPRPEGFLWLTLGAAALALAVCLPSMAAAVSDAVGPAEQGRALGANQSLQVGAEAVSGLAGGGLAAVATALPLPVMALLALGGAGLYARPGTRRATAPAAS